MGKPLHTQRRGKGSPAFRTPKHRFKGDSKYRNYDEKDKEKVSGKIINFIDDPGRDAILAKVMFETKEVVLIPACESMALGQIIEEGYDASLKVGNILPLEKIPEGYPVCNIEVKPGDGGSLVRSSGGCAFIISKTPEGVEVQLPSGKKKVFDGKCRATIGCIAGGERTEKPLLKAGNAYYKYHARNRLWPVVRGNKMSVYDHPFGGKQHHGAITIKKVGGAPGQHVGSFGAKRTGRRKR
ncbi:MAG: 50S ribosomal protein L2 [archaeon]